MKFVKQVIYEIGKEVRSYEIQSMRGNDKEAVAPVLQPGTAEPECDQSAGIP